jgi:hypothetical protein
MTTKNGTTTLFAALPALDGKVAATCNVAAIRYRFLNAIRRRLPPAIVPRSSAITGHKHDKVPDHSWLPKTQAVIIELLGAERIRRFQYACLGN